MSKAADNKEVLRHERRIQGALRRAWVEGHGWSPCTDETPVTQMMLEEYDGDLDGEAVAEAHYWPSNSDRSVELQVLKAEEAAAVAAWARRRQVQWLLGGGLHPFPILQRVYGLCYVRYQEFLGPMNQTWLAEILGQGRAAFSALIKRLFTKPIKDKTGITMLAPGQKSVESKAVYAANAVRVAPKRHLDSCHLDEGTETQVQKDLAELRQKKLRAARLEAERREMAALIGCDPNDPDLNPEKWTPNNQETDAYEPDHD